MAIRLTSLSSLTEAVTKIGAWPVVAGSTSAPTARAVNRSSNMVGLPVTGVNEEAIPSDTTSSASLQASRFLFVLIFLLLILLLLLPLRRGRRRQFRLLHQLRHRHDDDQ